MLSRRMKTSLLRGEAGDATLFTISVVPLLSWARVKCPRRSPNLTSIKQVKVSRWTKARMTVVMRPLQQGRAKRGVMGRSHCVTTPGRDRNKDEKERMDKWTAGTGVACVFNNG